MREEAARRKLRIFDAICPLVTKVHMEVGHYQDEGKKLTGDCDLILVVGSQNSSNSTRLMEISQKKGVPAYLIDNVTEIQREWLQGKAKIGLTAGASAPEVLVEEVIEQLKEWGVENVVEAPGIQESVVFSLPRELYAGAAKSGRV